MRKNIIIAGGLAVAFFGACQLFTSCGYDDDKLWENVDNLGQRVAKLEEQMADANNDLKALHTIIDALSNQVTITSVTPTSNGYEIIFSDGRKATISNGTDGTSAPLVSVRQDEDGNYYWTLDGEWLIVDGHKVRANGIDGEDGKDGGAPGIAPQLRISTATGEWEISTDGGKTWTSTGVKAQGSDGDSLFSAIDASDPAYVLFTLADGTQFRLARYDASAPRFEVQGCDGVQEILAGKERTYDVTAENVADYTIAKPDGWRVAYADGKLTVTAPTAANTFAETEGTVAVTAVSASGRSLIVKIHVKAVPYLLRVLTFEDADARFDTFTLDYCGKTIKTWSDLIDDKQYGGQMLYGSGYGMDEPYWWYDQNNTELMHVMPEAYGSYCFWGGGHAVSNYKDTDLSHGDFMHQLSVYSATGGHNGSAQFVMHFGYADDSQYHSDAILPALQFGDGNARVIDHMYVMWSTYLANCLLNGNGLTTALGPENYVKLVAAGYDAQDNLTGKVELFIAGKNGNITDWTKWDLSPLGAVAKVQFNVAGDTDNGYGFSQPAYFAYDDVAVRFEE